MRSVRASIFARDVGGLWLAEAVVLISAVLRAAIVARILGPSAFGSAALIISSTTLVFTFLDPDSQDAVVRFLGAHRANGRLREAATVPKVAYGVDLLLGVVGFAVVAGGAPWIADHLVHSDDAVQALFVFAGASTFAAPSATSRGILTTLRRFSTVARLQASAAIFRTALTIALVAGGGGFRGVIYAESATLVVESLIAGVLAHRAMRSDLGFSWLQTKCSVLGDEIRHIVRFMIYTDLTSLANVFVKEGDVVILGLARGPTEAGYYRLAKALAAPIGSIVLPLQQAVYPRLAAMAGTGDVDGLRRATRRYTERIGIPIGALLLVALPLLPVVVPGMAGEDYRPAVATAAVLLAGAALTIPAFWARPMILAGGDVRVLFGISVVGTVLTVAGYVVFGNLWGGVGVAASRAVFASVLGTLALVVFSRPR